MMEDKNQIREISMDDFFNEVIRMKMEEWRLFVLQKL